MIELTATIFALLAFIVWQNRAWAKDRAEREKAWALERSGLLNRIQHPEFVVATPESPTIPDTEILRGEPDEIELVGEIMNGASNGD